MLNSSHIACSFSNSADACLICAAKAKRRYQWLERLIPGFTVFFLKHQQARIQAYNQRADYLTTTLNKASKMIAPSQFLRSIYIQGGTDPEKIIYSRQGRDFPHLSTQATEKPPAEYLRVGYIGQLTHIKGSHILLQALQQLPGLPIQVEVYGDLNKFPDYVKKLRKLAGNDQRIHLSGLFTPNQISQVCQGLDVVVVPSIWYENSPNVILEAFGHKTPVIASNLGGMAELVEDGRNGLLFEVSNPASLADQLRRLVEDRSLLERLRSGIAPLRSTADEIAELCQIYESVLEPAR